MDILYQDNYLIAINKPAGILVHRSSIDKKENTFALQMVRNSIGKHVFPIHRLDKPTSGVLLFALSSQVANDMSQLFKTNSIEKKYIAVVRGFIPDSGTINHPLKRIIDKYGKPSTKKDQKQDAITKYKSLATMELKVSIDKYSTSRYSLVELIPRTGRRHQLRRHLKHFSHPIIGDPKYGKSIHNNFFKNNFMCKRLLLAAVSLKFQHPYTKQSIYISAQPGDSFLSVIKLFDFNISEYLSKSIKTIIN